MGAAPPSITIGGPPFTAQREGAGPSAIAVMHRDPAHPAPTAHRAPQAPQFAESFRMSTQVLPQFVSGAGQADTHPLDQQEVVPVHAFPQRPQF